MGVFLCECGMQNCHCECECDNVGKWECGRESMNECVGGEECGDLLSVWM